MKRTRVSDISGDCKANSCLMPPVCTIWKANTASKVLTAAVGSLSLERWRGQAPQTELQGFEGWLASADPFQRRTGVHLTWDSWCADWKPWAFNHVVAFSSLQSVIGVTWNNLQESHSQNIFPSWMQGERVRVEKVCGWPTCSWVPTHSVCLWKFIFSYIISRLNYSPRAQGG